MRIAYVGTAYPMRGGIAQYNALLCRELARRHDVRLYSFTRQYPGLLFPGKTQMEAGTDAAPFPARPMIDSVNPLTWTRAAHAIAAERPDALLFKYWMPFFAPCFGTIARRVRRETARRGEEQRARVVLICDNVVPHEKRLLDEPLTRWMLGASDAFVVMSKQVEEDLLRFRPDARYEKVPHPLYEQFGEPQSRVEARESLGWDPEDRVLLFFGYIRRYKGLDTLLRAMPEMRRRLGPRLRLVVLGEFYEDRQPYDRLVEELGIASAVTMTGDYVANERVGPAFSASDLVVLPYRSATQSGIVQVAYQLERPVVCTRVGGLAEMVADGATGILVPPDDPAALAAAVARYFEEDLEPSLVAGIHAARAGMGWDRLAEAIVRLVERSRSSGGGSAEIEPRRSGRRSASGRPSEGSEP